MIQVSDNDRVSKPIAWFSRGVLGSDGWLPPDFTGWALLIGAGISSVLAWIGFADYFNQEIAEAG